MTDQEIYCQNTLAFKLNKQEDKMSLEANPPLSGEWDADNYTIPSFKFPDPVPCQYCGCTAQAEVFRFRSESKDREMYVCVSCLIDLIEKTNKYFDPPEPEVIVGM